MSTGKSPHNNPCDVSADHPAATASTGVPQPPRSLRSNFRWAFLGNLIYQASQWLSLVLMSRLLDVADVGRYALSLAICLPITSFAALNLRAVQVTDTKNDLRFGHYLGTQILTSQLAVVAIVIIAVTAYESSTAWLIIVVGLGQAAHFIRSAFIAFYQKYERMDSIAGSTAIYGLGSLAALGLTLWATRSLLLGVIAMYSARLAVLLFWDIRATARLACIYVEEPPATYLRPIFSVSIMLGLCWLALPLGIGSVLMRVTNSAPRYIIDVALGSEPLGFFAAIIALVIAGSMVIDSANISALPRLRKYYLDNRIAFRKLILKLITVALFLGLLGTILAYIAGDIILTIMFTKSYAAYADLFFWSMFFGILIYIVAVIRTALLSTKSYLVECLGNAVSLAVTLLSGLMLIPAYELFGAVASLALGQAGYLLTTCPPFIRKAWHNEHRLQGASGPANR